MEKKELIDRFMQDREIFDKTVNQAFQKDKFSEHVNKKWTVKDLVGHILWYEEEMVKLLEYRSLNHASPNWRNDFDERNQLIFQEMRSISSEDLIRRREVACDRIAELLDEIDRDALNDSEVFDNMPSEWVPWQIFSQNTFNHYRDHISAIWDVLE